MTFTLKRFGLTTAAAMTVIAIAAGSARAEDGFEKKPIQSFLQWQAFGGANRNPVEFCKLKAGNIIDDLAANQTGKPVQEKQRKVVAKLDTLIKQMEDQMKAGDGPGGNGSNGSKPMAHSQLAAGPGGSGPLHDPAAGNHTWSGITPKEREKILQSQTEGFPPGYQSELSSYYSRLAAEDATTPTTRPAR